MRLPPLVISLALMLGGAVAAQAPALKIVVVEGEGGVNIIQQKTAVRPLVEVRDRNNLPVPGAAVTFTIGGRNAAFAGGVQTLMVTTNAAGQAAAGGLNAIGSGAFQIQVQAAYQGQIATAAISQTNFATAAAAAQAGASAGGAGSGGAGASGVAKGAAGGGGISATTIGLIGAAVGGGALAATTVTGGGVDREIDVFSGPVSTQLVLSNVRPNSTCISTRAFSGTLKIEVFQGDGSGTLFLETTHTEVALGGNPTCIPDTQRATYTASGKISGAPSAITFSNTGGSAGAQMHTTEFRGFVSGTTLTGTLTIQITQQGADPSGSFASSGSTSVQVTLQK